MMGVYTLRFVIKTYKDAKLFEQCYGEYAMWLLMQEYLDLLLYGDKEQQQKNITINWIKENWGLVVYGAGTLSASFLAYLIAKRKQLSEGTKIKNEAINKAVAKIQQNPEEFVKKVAREMIYSNREFYDSATKEYFKDFDDEQHYDEVYKQDYDRFVDSYIRSKFIKDPGISNEMYEEAVREYKRSTDNRLSIEARAYADKKVSELHSSVVEKFSKDLQHQGHHADCENYLNQQEALNLLQESDSFIDSKLEIQQSMDVSLSNIRRNVMKAEGKDGNYNDLHEEEKREVERKTNEYIERMKKNREVIVKK